MKPNLDETVVQEQRLADAISNISSINTKNIYIYMDHICRYSTKQNAKAVGLVFELTARQVSVLLPDIGY